MARLIAVLSLVTVFASAADARLRSDYSLELGLEGRYHPQEPLDPQQEDSVVSLRAAPEAYWAWGKRRAHSVTFEGFGRVDSVDEERSHADVRELYYGWRGRSLELRVGVRRVFWGATESVHLVDIINQTDFVETPDGEDKLGQPMVNLAWVGDLGTVDFFVLPYFRERTFAGPEGRLRFHAPPPQAAICPGIGNCFVNAQRFNYDEPIYESADEETHLDYAVRWTKTLGSVDLGLSHFSGTARAPEFRFVPTAAPVPGPGAPLVSGELRPYYGLVDVSGLTATWVAGGLLAKLEATHTNRHGGNTFTSAAGGFEYTFVGVVGAWDAGLVMEYLWDERLSGSLDASPFNNDLFLATRLAGNDIAGTEILAGAVTDLDSQTVFANIEASRRFGPNWKGVLELRAFSNVADKDPLRSFQRDDYLSLELIRYF